MAKTEGVTQRAEHSTVMDRLSIDDLITGYAIAMDDGDWPAYRDLFTADGRVDYRSAGGIEGDVDELAAWLAKTLTHFPVRQHLIVNRRITLDTSDGAPGDTATVQADYLNPMRMEEPTVEGVTGNGTGPVTPNYTCAGRYVFAVARTADGWRLTGVVVHEKWRQVVPAGR